MDSSCKVEIILGLVDHQRPQRKMVAKTAMFALWANAVVAVAYEIKEGMETVRQNEKECSHIEMCVARITPLISRLGEVEVDEATRHSLEDLAETMSAAMELVAKCRRRQGSWYGLGGFIGRKDMAVTLRKAQDDISRKFIFGSFVPTVEEEGEGMGNPLYSGHLSDNARMEGIQKEIDLLESVLSGSENPRNVKLSTLQFITKNFSDELKIGSGGCGVVYKGILRNQIIAVKRLFNSHTTEDKIFHQEVKSMMMVNHKNVVQFLGYCSHTEEQAQKMEGQLIMAEDRERLLCFEHVINGSLQSYLTDELRGLEWKIRYKIIKGICDGLGHLHSNHIIHMDLKPANILLGSNMEPKITDFGLSRLDNISQTMSSERLVSLGYCAPEYLHHGKMSAKSDIYSLGVIILLLLTGCKEDPNITKVHRRWKHRWNKTAKDAQLGYKQVATCLHLVGRCMQIDPADRPNIWDIISCLNKMDSIDAETSDGTTGYMELEDMLGIEPLKIHLPFELNKQISCCVELTNDTDDNFAFRVSTNSLRPYRIEANEGIVPPRSKCSVTISMQALDKALPGHQCRDEFSVQSTRADGSIGGDNFNEEAGKVIDTVNFSVVLSEAAASPSADL